MDSDRLREVAERDQLWASLRVLQPEIIRIAAGAIDGSERQGQILQLLAKVVAAELDFRARDGGQE
jgi:hypothetical protein